MRIDIGPENIKDILGKRTAQKPPVYPWQDLALRIIKELGIPNFKRNSVFKICKEVPRNIVEQAMNDTKELCRTGERWKYFFKVIDSVKKNQTSFKS